MINARVMCFSASILSILGTFGCGIGDVTAPSLTTVSGSTNPLVAQYSIARVHAGASAWVEFGTDTTYGRQTSTISAPATAPKGGQTLTILVAGMKAQTTYHMRAHVEWPNGSWVDQDQTFTTGALPSNLTLPGITVTQPSANLAPAPGVELLSLVAPGPHMMQDIVTDVQGNIIWYCPFPGVPIKPMPNGHYFLNVGTDLEEMDLACNTIRDVSLAQVEASLQAQGSSFPVLNEFHHDMLVLPNGHWIALAQITKNYTDLPGYPGTTGVLGDVLLDIDTNGNVVWTWSSFDYLDVNRALMGLPDWTHSNALVYTSDGNLLLSMRNQSWILKIDYANGSGSGNVKWKLGEDGDFTLLGGDPSDWFYAQHYPNILSTNGAQTTMAIYDDGNLRLDSQLVACGTTPSAPTCYTRATIFQIDEGSSVANLTWQDLPGFFSFWGGSIDTLSNGDVEFNSSEPFDTIASQIMEVSGGNDNPQLVWQMNITGENAYRGYRIPSLYPGVSWQH